MHIIIWFVILATLALIASIVTAVTTYRYNRFSPIPLVAIWAGLALVAFGFYYASSNVGGYVSETHYATSFEIDDTTYTYDGDTNKGTFNFYSTDGVHFSFSSADLLADVPASPKKVDMYVCTFVKGYRWCQLGSKELVQYVLQ